MRRSLVVAWILASGCRFDSTGGGDADDGGIVVAPDAALPADAGDEADATVSPGRAADVLLGFAPRTGPRLHTRNWRSDGQFFSEELETPNVGSKVRWVLAKVQPGPAPAQLLAAVVDAAMGPQYSVMVRAGAGWEVEWSAVHQDAEIDFRGFDLEFEAAGDALAVYADGSNTPLFRRREGGVWSAPQSLPINDGAGPGPDTNLGTVQWIELERRPGTDQIGLTFADSTGVLVALVWTGSAWDLDTAKALELNLKRTGVDAVLNNRVFDLAFESSGDMLVAWARDFNGDVFFNNLDSATGEWQLTPSQRGGFVTGLPHFIDLAARDDSDEIAACVFDLGEGQERVGAGIWTGDTWADVGEVDDFIIDANDQAFGLYPGQVTWLIGLDQALCTYPDLTAGSLTSLQWTRDQKWQRGPSLALSAFERPRETAVVSFPGGTGALATAQDDAGSVYAATYDGTEWTVQNSGVPVAQTIADQMSSTVSIDVQTE